MAAMPIPTFNTPCSADAPKILPVRTVRTADPLVKRFLADRPLRAGNRVAYADDALCPHVPLAEALLRLEHVQRIEFFAETVTVHQTGGVDWDRLAPKIGNVIKAHLATHEPNFPEFPQSEVA